MLLGIYDIYKRLQSFLKAPAVTVAVTTRIMRSLIDEKGKNKQSSTLALHKLYSPVSDLFAYLSHGLNSALFFI